MLVLNCGSATVKFAVITFGTDGKTSRRIDGLVDGIGSTFQLRLDGREVPRVTTDQSGYPAALALIHTGLHRLGGPLEHSSRTPSGTVSCTAATA